MKPSISGISASMIAQLKRVAGLDGAGEHRRARRRRLRPMCRGDATRLSISSGCGGSSRCRRRRARGGRAGRRLARIASAVRTLDASAQSVKWKALPLPTSLSIQIRPPINSHELCGDSEPEARPAITTGRRSIGLHERAEDLPLLRRRDADAGITDGKVDVHFVAARVVHPLRRRRPPRHAR